MGAIMLTIYNIAQNSFARAFNEVEVGIEVGALRGIVAGGIGGAGLGLALKDKIRTYTFALAGAIGFGIAFALVISIDSSVAPNIGRAIIRLMGNPGILSMYETELAHGLGTGAIVGAVGGSVLGLAAPKYKAISCLLLCFAGIVSFANVFAVGNILFDGDFFSAWNAWGGAVGGAVLGAALSLYYIISDHMVRR